MGSKTRTQVNWLVLLTGGSTGGIWYTVYLALKWSIDPGKAISNKSRVVEYYADFLIYSLSIPMYVAVLLFVYYLWEADAKEEEKGPSSYQLCA